MHPQEGQHSADASSRRDPGPSAATRPVKRAPGTGAVIATCQSLANDRGPWPSAPGEAFIISFARRIVTRMGRDPGSRFFRDLRGSGRIAPRA
jgi:hypothetical protein